MFERTEIIEVLHLGDIRMQTVLRLNYANLIYIQKGGVIRIPEGV